MTRTEIVRRTLGLALFLAPIAYLGVILGVAIHEVVGHGLVAVLLGGEFTGFSIMWDGMGYAAADVGSSSWKNAILLLGGFLSTVAFGLLFAAAAIRARRPEIRLALWILTAAVLLDSAAYTLWSALHPGTVGDAARVVAMLDNSAVQVGLVILGATSTIAFTWLPAANIVAQSRALVFGTREGGNIWCATLFFVIPFTLGYYTFDWNQLVGGIGMLPAHANVVLHVFLTPLVLRWLPRERDCRSQLKSLVLPSIFSWGTALLVASITVIWLGEGVAW